MMGSECGSGLRLAVCLWRCNGTDRRVHHLGALNLDRHLYKQTWYIVPFVHTLAKVCTNEFSHKFSRIFSARTLQIQVAHQHER